MRMGQQAKKVRGKLFDLYFKRPLGEGDVNIVFTQEPTLSRLVYEGTITLQGRRTDLDGKTCHLQLNPGIAGDVFLYLATIVALSELANETTLNIAFRGLTWISVDWFHFLL
jgi:hypothetical protein